MYFRNFRLSKTWLDHCLKSAVSEHPSTFNMLKGRKHLWNLLDGTFIIFFHHSEGKLFWKCLPYWNLESEEFFLTHSLPITTISLETLGICSFLLKWNNLENEILFLNFLFHLLNLHEILNIFEKRMIAIVNVFPKLQTVKDLVRLLSKKRHFRTSFKSQHVKGSQTLVKSAWERF